MDLAGVSVRRVEDITEALWGMVPGPLVVDPHHVAQTTRLSILTHRWLLAGVGRPQRQSTQTLDRAAHDLPKMVPDSFDGRIAEAGEQIAEVGAQCGYTA